MSKISEKIFSKISTEEYFEEWFDQTKAEDNFNEYIGFCSCEEEFLKEVKEEFASDNNLELSKIQDNSIEFKKFYNLKEDQKIKDLAYDWFLDRLCEFTYELESIGELSESGIICYRSLKVDDIEEFLFLTANKSFSKDFKGIGVCWSWHKDKAEAHWGNGKEEIIIKALIPFSIIEQKTTLWLNLNPSLGVDEAEIRIKEGREIEILEINGQSFPAGFKIKS